MFDIVIIMPVFQHGEMLRATLARLAPFEIPALVVCDGNPPPQRRLIEHACRQARIKLIHRIKNGGKGAAVIDGLREALRCGHSHAFQIDADGQHDISGLAEFIRVARERPQALILGCPRYDESRPLSRRLGRWLTHVWVYINTWSWSIRDSMCGFRIYPIAPILKIIDNSNIGRRMNFDPELCVRACWNGMPIINMPVAVSYPKRGRSNFRLGADNMLITAMHTRLFFGMLRRAPRWLSTRLRARLNPNHAQSKKTTP